jgi:hypothetical protein
VRKGDLELAPAQPLLVDRGGEAAVAQEGRSRIVAIPQAEHVHVRALPLLPVKTVSRASDQA